jgi:hypothetical protein
MTETLQRPAASAPPQPEPPAFLRRPLVVGARWAPHRGGARRPRRRAAGCRRLGRRPPHQREPRRLRPTAGQIWLAAHGAAVDLADGRFDLAPLASPCCRWRCSPAPGRAASSHRRATSVRGAARAAASVAVPYAALCTGVAALSATAALRPSLVSAGLAGLLTGALGAGAGALRPDRLWRAAWLRLGDRTRRTLPAATAAVAALLAGGALLVGGSLLGHFGPGDRPRRCRGPGCGRRSRAAAAGALLRPQRRRLGRELARRPRLRRGHRDRRRALRPPARRRPRPAAARRPAVRRGARLGSARARSASRWPQVRSPDAAAPPSDGRPHARRASTCSSPRLVGRRCGGAGRPAAVRGRARACRARVRARVGLAVAVEVAVGALGRRRAAPPARGGRSSRG